MNAQEPKSSTEAAPYEGPRDVRERIDQATSGLLSVICDLEVRPAELLSPEQRTCRLEILRHLTYARRLLVDAYEQTNTKFHGKIPRKLHV